MHQKIEEIGKRVNPKLYGQFECFYRGWSTYKPNTRCVPPFGYSTEQKNLYMRGWNEHMCADVRDNMKEAGSVARETETVHGQEGGA